MTSKYDTYSSPLAERNASPEMLRLWSPRHKFNTWRRIWLAVAEAQHEVSRDWPTTKGRPPLVTMEQVEELRAVVDRGIRDEEIENAERYERELRHDVMAHVHALGDSCPKAKGIIHLGMTSQDVNDNADLMVLDASLELVLSKCRRAVCHLANRASEYIAHPTLSFTHYQAAQPTTLGRRFVQWGSELELAIRLIPGRKEECIGRLRGLRGATGTQASYLELMGGDIAMVDEFEARAIPGMFGWPIRPKWDDASLLEAAAKTRKWLEVELNRSIAHHTPGGPRAASAAIERLNTKTIADLRRDKSRSHIAGYTLPLVTQTYPRVIDTFILSDLAAVASVLHKIATDIRLLCNRKELDEPFESKQIGSSAMPYKRNPMRCERICGLSRFVMNLVGNAYDTAATQWLERTLDDSSNRRLSLPEAFLALDGALDLMQNVASGLIVHEAMVRKNLMAELPFLATENILMACVKLYVGFPGSSTSTPTGALGTPTLRVGSAPSSVDAQEGIGGPTRSVGVPGSTGDRQHYHELIRVHAQAAGMRVKQEGLDNDLLDRLKADRNFWGVARGGPLREELDWDGLLDPMKYVGRSVEQTERFIKEVVEPLREQYAESIEKLGESTPRV